MANKRFIKKAIKFTCGDIAGECLFTKYAFEGVNPDTIDDIILKDADLQTESLKKVSISYDKTLASFNGDVRAYRKARRAYYKQAYSQLKKEINEAVLEIVKELNAAIPQAQKDANKKALAEK